MYRSFTCEELLSLSNDEVNALKGLDVVVTKRDGNVIESTIDKIMVAVDPSCLPCYFVPSDDPSCLPCGFVLSDGKEVRFDSIRRMEIESAR